MTSAYLLVSGLYTTFALSLLLFERRRTRPAGIDGVTIFIVLFFLQCCLPGMVMYAALPFVDPMEPTGNPFFDKVFLAIDPATALLVLSMTVWFVVFFYVGCAIARLVLKSRSSMTSEPLYHLLVFDRRLVLLLVAGLGVTLWSFWLMGDSFIGRYANLILLRADFEGVERTTLNSIAISLTQAWSWLSVIALFAVRERRGRRLVWLVCLAFLVVFALLGVSRRAIFLPLLLAYLTLVLYDGAWRTRWVLLSSVPLLLLVGFGKGTFAAVAGGAGVERLAGTYQSTASALLRPMADVGITIVESLGTLMFVDVDLRFGIDHVLSVAQRFPEGMLGWDFGFPERIVRISTTAFADASAQDIPPGLFGQMWLDFGILGPLLWGLVFGLQVGVVTCVFEHVRRTRLAAAVVVLLIFVVALPLNSGSFDFTFSIDIFAVLLGLLLCVRLRRQLA